MGHHHHHHGDPSLQTEHQLWLAMGANMLLTLAQLVGGVLSGSLALAADALHNFSDAASLLIALVAIRIGRKPPDQFKTFGYKRAETIAALINFTTLALLGLYLLSEAMQRFVSPEPVEGWSVIVIAGLALVVDIFTALVTYRRSKESANIRAVFLHNLTDALASVGVIVAGLLILMYGWLWADSIMTLLIAGYVLYHSAHEMPIVVHLLMEGTPRDISIEEVIKTMEQQQGVENVHHVHIWQLDETRNALEAHVVLRGDSPMDEVKHLLKAVLSEDFNIRHSTLEFEQRACGEGKRIH